MTYKDELKQKKRKKTIAKIIFIFVISFSAFLAAAYFILFSNYTQIKNLSVVGADDKLINAVADEAQKILNAEKFGVKWQNNILFFSIEDMNSKILGKFLELKEINVSKKIDRTIKISVKPRQMRGAWCLYSLPNPSCFKFDESGIAYQGAALSVGYIILNIKDFREKTVEIGQTVSDSEWLNSIIVADDILQSYSIKPGGFVIPKDSLDEFRIEIDGGTEILLSNLTDIEKQMISLVNFLDQRVKDQKPIPKIIDLRINDRIYFK